MTRRATSFVAIAAACLFAGSALAQQSPSSSEQPGQQANASAASGQQADQQYLQAMDKIQQDKDKAADELFLLNTAIGSQFEVQLSQQVESRSQDDHVKKVAQQIIKDHEQANQQLMQTAQKLGMQVPQGLPELKSEEIQVIASLPQKEMDQQYIACMQSAHAHDITAFQTASQTAKDQDVKQFASATLPKLEQHMMHVQRAATAMGLPVANQAMEAGYRQGASGASGSSSYGTGASGQSGAGFSGSNNANGQSNQTGQTGQTGQSR